MSAQFALIVLLALQIAALPAQVVPRVTANLEGYCEGIVFDDHDAAYVSVLHREAVYRIRKNGPPAIWFRVKEPNGHKILPDGSHLIAARGGIYHVAPDARLLEILGQSIATPNDLAIDGDGGAYISAPAELKRDQRARRSKIYYLGPNGSVHQVADGFRYPNGLVVRPDGRALLVNDTDTRLVYELQISSPGNVSGRRVFAELSDAKAGPDGMTLDEDGRLYVADYGTGFVAAFDVDGRLLRRYSTGLRHPSNVAFLDRDVGELYVTGAPIDETGTGQLVVLALGVRGRSSLATPLSLARR